jgi:hypothetical protein
VLVFVFLSIRGRLVPKYRIGKTLCLLLPIHFVVACYILLLLLLRFDCLPLLVLCVILSCVVLSCVASTYLLLSCLVLRTTSLLPFFLGGGGVGGGATLFLYFCFVFLFQPYVKSRLVKMCTSTFEERRLAIWFFVVITSISTIATGGALYTILKSGDVKQKFNTFTFNILLSDLFHACGGLLFTLVWGLHPLQTDNMCDASNWDEVGGGLSRAVVIASISLSAMGFASSAIWIASVTYSLLKQHEHTHTARNRPLFHAFAWTIGEDTHRLILNLTLTLTLT